MILTLCIKKGSENGAADALSRILSHKLLCLGLSSVSFSLNQQIMDSYKNDPGVLKIIHELQQNPSSHSSFTWERDQLRRKGRMVVGRDHGLQTQILNWFHSSRLGGHSGVHATYQRMSTILYWKRMWKSVREFVRNCSICQQNKAENVASLGLLQPFLIPTSIFSYISMDFVKGLPRS